MPRFVYIEGATAPSDSPGTASMIASFDFNDTVGGEGNDDSHSTFDWTENGTPVYTTSTPYYVTLTAANTLDSTTNSLDASFGSSDADWSFATRVKIDAAITNGDFVLKGNFDRFAIRYLTGSTSVELMDVADTSGPTLGTGTYKSIIGSYKDSTSTLTVWIEGTGQTPVVGTGLAGSGGTINLKEECEYDYLYLWNKELTSANAAWLYNSGGTRVYADL